MGILWLHRHSEVFGGRYPYVLVPEVSLERCPGKKRRVRGTTTEESIFVKVSISHPRTSFKSYINTTFECSFKDFY